MQLICLDYDGSYTEFQMLFKLIINYCLNHDIEVIMCTMRYEYEKDSELRFLETEIRVYYTGRKAKELYLKELGVFPSLWIDDQPIFILNDAK